MKRLALTICVCGFTYVWLYVGVGQARQNAEKSIAVVVSKDKSAVDPQSSKDSFICSSKPVRQSLTETVGSAAGANKSLKSIKLNKMNRIQLKGSTIKFAEVEVVLNNQFNVEYICSLSRAPGSSGEVLSDSNSLRVQLPAGQVKALVDEGADVTVLRKFILIEGGERQAGVLGDGSMPLASCSGPYEYGENNEIVYIPDDDSGWAYSDIYISTAPTGAMVTCIDVHYEIIHTYVEDLLVDLTDQDLSYEYHLWENEGGSADYIDETVIGISTFNGELVNQIWTLWALDTYPYLDSGTIDHWWIKVYYEVGDDFYVQADSYFENTSWVFFSFSSNPGTVCFSASDDCGSFDPVCAEPVFEDGSYWVSTEYIPCEEECITVTITADPEYGSDMTKEAHLSERFHIGCCTPMEVGCSTYDPQTGEPAAAQVNVSVIPEEAGTAEPSSGMSQWDPEHGVYLFWTTYIPNCDYTGRVRVRMQASGMVLIYSFDQNPILSSSLRWQTISESFCPGAGPVNYYQVYKMYLCANASYDFSLCDNDGVGASCDGDGDLEIFDSSCVSQWYIDGDLGCGYDASTLGTDYEGWSPTSDGYYYLMVSDYSFDQMSYSLAYRGGTLGDFEPDCDVDFVDFAILGDQWLQPPGIPSADIAPEVPDNFVDTLDLAAFVENWLEGIAP